ncbi:hypothetical protein QAD02_020998 [Eretmocerus hayati]|uniref:Uncharacterized protein n=1 Tax=Eretmocerus hayati TaxID=131215 RepID=A0ACC2PP69_9HYME|nr:hypothetical protein QAD02_020998 [Eretmocerus hayati]
MQEENGSMLAEHAVHIQTHPSSDAEGGIGRKIAEHDVRPVPSHNDTPGNDLHDYVIDDYEYLVDGGNDISMVNGVVENKEPCIKGEVNRKKQYWSVSLSSGELLIQTTWINETMFTINLRNEDTCFIFDHFNWKEVCEMYEKARIHIRNDEIQSKKVYFKGVNYRLHCKLKYYRIIIILTHKLGDLMIFTQREFEEIMRYKYVVERMHSNYLRRRISSVRLMKRFINLVYNARKKKEIRLFERMDVMDYFIKKGLLDEDRNKDVISTHLDYIMLEAVKQLQLDSSMETGE